MKKRTRIILIILTLSLYFAFGGVFASFLGSRSSIAYALNWNDPPPESNYYINSLITRIVDSGTWWTVYWETQYSVLNGDNSNELFFMYSREYWDEGTDTWLWGGWNLIGGYPCEQSGGIWYFKSTDANYNQTYFSDAELTTYGTGYYRGMFYVGEDGYGSGDPYFLVHWDGVILVLVEDLIPPEARVWGVDPASTTEVNNLADILTVNYEGLDVEIYDSLFISFQNQATGIFSNAKEYLISEIGESGELEIPLTDFNIEKNGNWYLYANATYEGYQYEGGYFLSGYGYNWTDDLTNGEYYLFINIEGYEGFFEMSDFEEWYGDNAKFDTPTTMFSAIAGFFDPIFSKIGEFGFRITTYFDNNTAYSKGYEIGRAIPLFSYYLGQVGVFMGGFPLLNWLLIIILLLVGIFIFRVILKFIPFLGGS